MALLRLQSCSKLCKLSELESCCELAEAAIGGHDAHRVGALVGAEAFVCSFACCICVPYAVRRRLTVHELSAHVGIDNWCCYTHGPSWPSTALSWAARLRLRVP